MAVYTSNYHEAVQSAPHGKAPRAQLLSGTSQGSKVPPGTLQCKNFEPGFVCQQEKYPKEGDSSQWTEVLYASYRWSLTPCEASSGDDNVYPSSCPGFHILGWESASGNKTACSTILCAQQHSTTSIMMAGFTLNNLKNCLTSCFLCIINQIHYYKGHGH